MAIKGKLILVTGASGFVGRHLAAELKRRGAEVVPLDKQEQNPVDIRDWQSVSAFGRKFGNIDIVYHLAALMLVPYSFENPRELYEVNVLGTLNILELCRVHNVKKLVFASSYVYGNPQYLPIDEAHPLNPSSPYARSKVIGEDLCKAYHEDYGLNCIILRPFNIYGEGQSDNFLIPTILKQLASGQVELTDPEPKRDFLYISDAIAAYVKAGEYDESDFEIFNIGTGVSYSVRVVADRILEAWGKTVEVSYKHQKRRGEIMDVVATTQKAKGKLGWEPKVAFEDGIKRCVEWYKKSFTRSRIKSIKVTGIARV
jgi:UDP-glucose 4-epimerase